MKGLAVTVAAATHLLGRIPVVVACYDADGHSYEPDGTDIDIVGSITTRSAVPMTGTCKLR
jgi:hypothetical protein